MMRISCVHVLSFTPPWWVMRSPGNTVNRTSGFLSCPVSSAINFFLNGLLWEWICQVTKTSSYFSNLCCFEHIRGAQSDEKLITKSHWHWKVNLIEWTTRTTRMNRHFADAGPTEENVSKLIEQAKTDIKKINCMPNEEWNCIICTSHCVNLIQLWSSGLLK